MTWAFHSVFRVYYAVRIVCGKRHKTVECPSVRLSVPSIDRSSDWRFAAEVGRGQQISIDGCCCRTTWELRKFWSDCREVQYTRFEPYFYV